MTTRYPGAVWRGPSPNCGGAIGAIRLGVIHVMTGSLTGTDSWFMNPKAQVSAHFGVGKNGVVHQYLGVNQVAWAEANYNDCAISIEHEGHTGDSLTPTQVAADQALVQWLEVTCGIPQSMTTDPNGTGWIGHGQLGVAGGSHFDCPGSPILAQWPSVLSALPAPIPTPPTPAPLPLPMTQETTAMQMQFVSTDSHKLVSTDAAGDIFGSPGAIPFVVTMAEVRAKYSGCQGGTASEPVVGLYEEQDTDKATLGYSFFTKPASGVGGFGQYNRYHIDRDGTF